MENKHSQNIPEEILATAQQKINEANAILAPFMINITPSERKKLLKMGDKSLAFVTKAIELAKQNPVLCPNYLNMENFEIDFSDATKLIVIKNSAKQLQEALEDTSLVAGSEAYQAALMFYSSVKEAASKNVPNAKAVYEELKIRFAHITKKEVP